MTQIVLAHGTFDPLHYGHLLMLKAAARLGDRLVVTITADKYVAKGEGRPVVNEFERLEMIRALRCVDHAEIVRAKTAVPAIEAWKPAVYVKGADYKTLDKHGSLHVEREAVERNGGKLVLMETPLYSATALLERIGRWYTRSHATC